jgi:hypothetical protein
MKSYRGWFLVAGCLFVLGAVSNLAQADYDSSDNRVPSPTYSSTNQVTYSTPAGPYSISSFFDIFTEIQRVPPPDTGTGQTNSFFDVFTEIYLEGPGIAPGTRSATSQQTIHIDGVPNETWQTEMLQLNLTGAGLPTDLMIRESPTLASTGTTTIQCCGGGGVYHIDSFFDVFTELSIDGGQTWTPGNAPLHLVGNLPEPSGAALALVAMVAIGWPAARRGKTYSSLKRLRTVVAIR